MTLPEKPTSKNQKYYSSRWINSSSHCGGLEFLLLAKYNQTKCSTSIVIVDRMNHYSLVFIFRENDIAR